MTTETKHTKHFLQNSNREQRLLRRLQDLWMSCVHFRWTFQQYLEELTKFKKSRDYSLAQKITHEFLRGYEQALADQLYKHELEFLHCWHGKWCRFDSIKHLADFSWDEVQSSAHFWKPRNGEDNYGVYVWSEGVKPT